MSRADRLAIALAIGVAILIALAVVFAAGRMAREDFARNTGEERP